VFTFIPGFGRAGRPILRVEYAEARDVVDDTEVRRFVALPALLTLRVLPCVLDLLCPNEGPSCVNDLGVLGLLGVRSDLPSKGPGAMLSMRFETLSPPSIRGLRGAKSGLGSAYRCCGLGSGLSRVCGLAL